MNNNNNSKSFLSFSLQRGFTCPNVPIATFYQDGVALNFIIDTGADDNVISSSVLSHIKYELLDGSIPIATAGGIQEARTCMIPLQYGEETFTTKFKIGDHLQESFDKIHEWHAVRLHGMIGSKFLIEHNIVLDFNNMIAYNKKE